MLLSCFISNNTYVGMKALSVHFINFHTYFVKYFFNSISRTKQSSTKCKIKF